MRKLVVLIVAIFLGQASFSQQFEEDNIGSEFEKVKVGGEFAIQLQARDHEAPVAELIDLKNNFN